MDKFVVFTLCLLCVSFSMIIYVCKDIADLKGLVDYQNTLLKKHEARLDFLQSKMEVERKSSVNDRQLKELQAMLRNTLEDNDKTINAVQTHGNVMEADSTDALPVGDIFRSMVDDLRRMFDSTSRSQSKAIERFRCS